MERRDFLRTSFGICLTGGAMGAVGTWVSSCASLPMYLTEVHQGTITIPLSIFHSGNIQIIHAQDMLYDIALKKENNGAFIALPLVCTHASNPLIYTGENFICPLHGSKFDQEGFVIHGPAIKPLAQLKTRLSSENIIISL
jgi:cytochrome b6-f complex iron-sulfur subunit